MKTFLAFLKWHWDKWDFTQKLWIAAMFLFGSGGVEWYETKEMPIQIQIAFGLLFVIMMKWTLWDMTVHSWKQFKQERKDLFKTIKESEHASESN